MCGIFFLLKNEKLDFDCDFLKNYFSSQFIEKYDNYKINFINFIKNKEIKYWSIKSIIDNLKNRGPDHLESYFIDDFSKIDNLNKIDIKELEEMDLNIWLKSKKQFLLIISSVLSLRNDNLNVITKQPLFIKNNILMFNGEIYSIDIDLLKINLDKEDYNKLNINKNTFNYKINDTYQLLIILNKIFDLFDFEKALFILKIFISCLNGQFSIVFFNIKINKIFIFKDYWGKKSLLFSYNYNYNTLVFSSNNHLVYDNINKNEFDNINKVDKKYLQCYFDSLSHNIFELPKNKIFYIDNYKRFTKIKNNLNLKFINPNLENWEKQIDDLLFNSTIDVIKNINHIGDHSGISILFSGGLDCSLIVNYCLKYNKNLEIDLVNISFQDNSFDRKSAIESYWELKNIFKDSKINLILVNKTYNDIDNIRNYWKNILYPSNNLIDLNIGSILYFSTQGMGINFENNKIVQSKSKIYLSGLGADEIFGGYSRYRIANTRENNDYSSVRLEMDFDIDRLWIRNLARDDRIISDNSKEVRFPFLNYELIRLMKSIDLKYIVDFNLKKGEGEKLLLRKIAKNNNWINISKLEKKAMQFGTGLAKLVNKVEYGSNRKGKASHKIK